MGRGIRWASNPLSLATVPDFARDCRNPRLVVNLIEWFYRSCTELWQLLWPLDDEMKLKTPAYKTISPMPAQGPSEKITDGFIPILTLGLRLPVPESA